MTRGLTGAAVPVRARRRVDGMLVRPDARMLRAVPVLVGLAALAVYVLPWLPAPAAHWPLWDVRVYWWGGRQAAAGGTLYAPGAPFSFTYPPFAAWLFSAFAGAPAGAMKIALTAGSLIALTVLCGQALAAAGIRRRPEIVFAVSALALQTWPVAYTLHLGEVNLILAALIGADLLGPRGGSGGSSPPELAEPRRDGAWWQGIGTGLAAGIKLTPLIFVAYLALTGRLRAAAVATGTFAITVAAGFDGLPGPSRTFWLGGVFYDQHRIGDPANPSDQSLSGAVARLAGTTGPPRLWWLVAVLVVGLAGLAVAVWAHRRGYRMAGFGCCAVTGLLVSPISWTHHWVWAVPLLVWLIAAAWRRRSAAWALAAVTAAVVFSDYTPLPWPGHPADPARMVASDLYVLFGLAVLAAAGIALARSQRIRPGRNPGATGGL
ncbi:MAG TPA: glycosyltransferase 87 family protein [Streptosporangiaceae bacterium]|nr:glycosyltransferase 87 family protein [Streptosporangiaceae bacterium]